MGLASSLDRPENARRGEIWYAKLDPTQGSEINKERPCVIISSDKIRYKDVRLAVPLTEEKKYEAIWHVKINPSIKNGLDKPSVADVLQSRCVSVKRFTRKIGTVTADQLEDIVAALKIVTEAE